MEKTIMWKKIEAYMKYLDEKERSILTKKQYRRDIERFLKRKGREVVTKESVIEYKEYLKENYRSSSVNVKLAAINSFFDFLGEEKLKVSQLKIQRKAYCSGEKELSKQEYIKLIDTAEKEQNKKLSLLIQTICGTGIRVSELKYLTVQSVRCGEAVIRLKGKTRTILIGGKLKKRLTQYAKKERIKEGAIFVTRNGKPLDRSNIWKMMKALCERAGVDGKKVFPHNLRHLFARCFYELDKDIAKLADVLGHSSINTTRIYIATSGWEHRRKIDALGLVQ